MSEWRDVEFGQIPKSWNVTTIDECTEIVTDYVANGSFASLKENVNYIDADGFAWLVRLRDYHNGFGNDRVWIDEHAYHFLAKSKLFGGEVIVSNVGQPGVVFRAPSRDKFPMSLGPNSIMMRFCESDAFYFYWLKSPFGQYMMDGIIGGSAQQKFNKTSFKKIECPRPPIQEQEVIAEVLSSLDDKIDLLKRQNKTLEGMAEALFRQWFIEEAQDDWEEVELQDLYKIKIGRTPPRKESEWFEDIESSQNWPWFSIKDMADCGTFISDSSEFITSEGQEKFKIPIIPPRTVVLSFKLTVGRVAITKRPMLSNEAIAHFIPSTTAPSDLVLFCFLKSLNYQSLGSTSSIAQAVNSGTIRKIQMPKFPQSVINRFDVLCSQWFDKINYNQEQLKVLKKKRDTLLPKLMSGEVRVQMD